MGPIFKRYVILFKKIKPKNLNVRNMTVLTWCNNTNGLGNNLHFDYDWTETDTYSYYIKETTNTSHAHREIKTSRYTAQLTYQIWDQDMWITPEKGQLIKTAPICCGQNNHTKLYPDSIKPLGFLPKSLCNQAIIANHMSSTDSVKWPGTDWVTVADLCHTLCLPGLLLPPAQSLRQTTSNLCLHSSPQTHKDRPGSVSVFLFYKICLLHKHTCDWAFARMMTYSSIWAQWL